MAIDLKSLQAGDVIMASMVVARPADSDGDIVLVGHDGKPTGARIMAYDVDAGVYQGITVIRPTAK